jgi:hypothetical protein
MQLPVIMAFRKRLKNWGYTEISIKRVDKNNAQNYTVKAVEPLSGTTVSCEKNIVSMHHLFRYGTGQDYDYLYPTPVYLLVSKPGIPLDE